MAGSKVGTCAFCGTDASEGGGEVMILGKPHKLCATHLQDAMRLTGKALEAAGGAGITPGAVMTGIQLANGGAQVFRGLRQVFDVLVPAPAPAAPMPPPPAPPK